ncbi:MAG: BatD family protein [Candidatus Scalindua sp.]|nr:BatD family protein [Candidatus Scalindua sp.]
MAEENDRKDSGDNPSASTVTANATVDKTKATIGERILYKVTTDAQEGTDIIFPEMKDALGDFGILESGTEVFQRGEGRATQERWFSLETFNTGSYIIPPIVIQYKRKGTNKTEEVKTPEIFIEIASTLDKNASDIRDIKPPVLLKKNYHRLYIVLSIFFGIFALAGTVFFFFSRKKQKESASATQLLSAHEIAYKELERLQSLDLISKGLIKDHYYYLSNIVRHYIENRFELMAPERTTEEFLTEMTTTDKLDKTHKELISNFLEHSDLVKFAEYSPQNQEIEDSYGSAKKLVDETKEVLEKASP